MNHRNSLEESGHEMRLSVRASHQPLSTQGKRAVLALNPGRKIRPLQRFSERI